MPNNDLSTETWFLERKAEQEAAHDGEILRAAAEARCRELPAGPVTLLATSSEGAALAGAIVAQRRFPTSWRQITLHAPAPVAGPVAVVEMVRLGPGLREVLSERYPEAQVLDGAVEAEPRRRPVGRELRRAA